MSYVVIERLIMVGGKHAGFMNVEAHISSSKNLMATQAVVTVTINVEDDPTLSVIQSRVLLQTVANLTPDEVAKAQ